MESVASTCFIARESHQGKDQRGRQTEPGQSETITRQPIKYYTKKNFLPNKLTG